jgi:site-specific DNA-methyltransferase (adenine-specific)
VLDPFMGSGSALVAAARLGRRYVGYDTDAAYVDIARRRVREALEVPAAAGVPPEGFQRRAAREGKRAQQLAEEVLVEAGFTITDRNARIPRTGVTVTFVATDAGGRRWLFDVSGAFKSHRGGLLRTDAVWKSLGRAAALRGGMDAGTPLVLLTTNLPRRPSEGDTALRSAGPGAFFDAVELLSDHDRARLARYAAGWTGPPEEGFWTPRDLAARHA